MRKSHKRCTRRKWHCCSDDTFRLARRSFVREDFFPTAFPPVRPSHLPPLKVGVWQQDSRSQSGASLSKPRAAAAEDATDGQTSPLETSPSSPSSSSCSSSPNNSPQSETLAPADGTFRVGDTESTLARQRQQADTAAGVVDGRPRPVPPAAAAAAASAEATCGEGTAGCDETLQQQQQQRQQPPGFARIVVTCEMLRSVLGPELYDSEVAARVAVPGTCTGMAWTPTGGELLFIECTSMPGSGAVKLTGKLGEVSSKLRTTYR